MTGTAHPAPDHAPDAHAAPHAHPNYVRVWAILVVLLVVSVIGPELNIRVVTLITAFGIALVKAYMVAKHFMHLNVERPIVHWALGFSLVFMVLLYAGVAPDVQKSEGQRWRKTAGYHYVSDAARGKGAGHGDHGAAAGDHGAAGAPETTDGQGGSGH
uniref:Caa(3)-type oxidase subunit IV n=1 Tax=Eiseniibacteriota bacterium TaxID=2212470 RepID=A0A832MJC9_UNCEI